ncbi:hypothetical protein AURDEDRAFT_164687 [Auricularia subglabra TFB-10046 SS5]|uniref:Uncharacterized protein n=1 Tax=Auricularia subglabra (strain TFB-10046 / SS5) TaxID=717982 RepID=J0WLQ9_AURST|nr:hypothetical protein AURDEDRAFT_178178 [Auricularia subglabra TFB-10046 SS5]EJD46028.1 hypothetical protein AURDEDRAFT_164687 [Auricularia subglabra TFB-10046 SS5]
MLRLTLAQIGYLSITAGTPEAWPPVLNRSMQSAPPSTPASSHSACMGTGGPDEPCIASPGPAEAVTALVNRPTPAPLGGDRAATIESPRSVSPF